jgi:hypothetical protein
VGSWRWRDVRNAADLYSLATMCLGAVVLNLFGSHGTHNSAELLADPVSSDTPSQIIVSKLTSADFSSCCLLLGQFFP